MSTTMEQQPWDMMVIGGGAAGFFAAITAAEEHPDWRILICEKQSRVLSKVRISGGGRCNLTHACFEPKELVRSYPRGHRELLGPFFRFSPQHTIEWFERRGLRTKTETDGRMFPISDRADDVAQTLIDAATHAGVTIRCNTNMQRIHAPPSESESESESWTVETSEQTYRTQHLVITTGGSPSVWPTLQALGHTIIDPVPSLFTFNTKDRRLEHLSGISIPWVRLQATQIEQEGPLLITHKGLSGPAVLKLSAWGARALAEHDYRFTLNIRWLGISATEFEAAIEQRRSSNPKQNVYTRPIGSLPSRLWRNLLNHTALPTDTRWRSLSHQQRRALAEVLFNSQLSITGKSTHKEEFVTAGGVARTDIDFRTFQSKRQPRLWLAGEVLDVDAMTGGFNFQAAWTGGWSIGKSIGKT